MDAIAAIASCAAIVLEMINNHIKDPKSRLEAIQDAEEKFKKLASEVTDGSNTPEKIDELESLFLDAVRAL